MDIITDVKENIIAAPIQAIAVRKRDKDDETSEEMDEVVFSSDSDTAIMHIVTTGIQDDDFIEIKTGLKAGDKIISGPYSTVSRTLETGTLVKENKEEDKKEEQSN